MEKIGWKYSKKQIPKEHKHRPKTLGKDDRSIESEDEGEVIEPGPLNLPELVGLDPTSLEQRVRNSLLSNQRFLVSRFRFDEVIELTNADVRKPNKLLQLEWVQNKFINIQVIWMQKDKLLQALLVNGVLTDSENAF